MIIIEWAAALLTSLVLTLAFIWLINYIWIIIFH